MDQHIDSSIFRSIDKNKHKLRELAKQLLLNNFSSYQQAESNGYLFDVLKGISITLW